MPTLEERLASLQQDIGQAGREASFGEDRGFGFDPEPYRGRMASQFSEEPQLKRLLPLLWRDFDANFQRFFSASDGSCALDFTFAFAAVSPAHSLAAKWVRGSEQFGPILQVHAWDEGTYVLRQNPSVNPEAPFVYLLIGTEKALLIDTGAPLLQGSFWPYTMHSTVTGLIERNRLFHGLPALELLVTHTHNHDDHRAGDAGFKDKPGIQFLVPSAGDLDLGGRLVTMIPTPGHSKEDYSFYDSRTQWLLTGDLLYPGRITVEDWPEFCASIASLVAFTGSHPVTAILGAHIEMTRTPGQDYPPDSPYHLFEHELPLQRAHLLELHELCQSLGDRPERTVRNDFILEPAVMEKKS